MRIFIVSYSSGTYEEYREVLVFATQDKEKAEKYVKKANGILERWMPFLEGMVLSENDFEYNTFVTRYNQLDEVNCFYIQEIELR